MHCMRDQRRVQAGRDGQRQAEAVLIGDDDGPTQACKSYDVKLAYKLQMSKYFILVLVRQSHGSQ